MQINVWPWESGFGIKYHLGNNKPTGSQLVSNLTSGGGEASEGGNRWQKARNPEFSQLYCMICSCTGQGRSHCTDFAAKNPKPKLNHSLVIYFGSPHSRAQGILLALCSVMTPGRDAGNRHDQLRARPTPCPLY